MQLWDTVHETGGLADGPLIFDSADREYPHPNSGFCLSSVEEILHQAFVCRSFQPVTFVATSVMSQPWVEMPCCLLTSMLQANICCGGISLVGLCTVRCRVKAKYRGDDAASADLVTINTRELKVKTIDRMLWNMWNKVKLFFFLFFLFDLEAHLLLLRGSEQALMFLDCVQERHLQKHNRCMCLQIK